MLPDPVLPDPVPPGGWTALLDRLEERLRRIEAIALARPAASNTGSGGGSAPDVGPAPSTQDVPAAAPTPDERLRLMALAASHDQLEARLADRRAQLRRAERYQLDHR